MLRNKFLGILQCLSLHLSLFHPFCIIRNIFSFSYCFCKQFFINSLVFVQMTFARLSFLLCRWFLFLPTSSLPSSIFAAFILMLLHWHLNEASRIYWRLLYLHSHVLIFILLLKFVPKYLTMINYFLPLIDFYIISWLQEYGTKFTYSLFISKKEKYGDTSTRFITAVILI